MKIFALVFCIIGCVAGIEHISVIGSDDKPNVLVIITDEHNFRTLGCYRDTLSTEQAEMWGPGSVVETPHFDRLAKEGVLCTRAYATAPVCSPCRAAMITGMYPQNTGVPTNNAELRADVPTLAKVMANRGYQTSFVGKWHLGGDGKPEWAPSIDGGFKNKTYMFNRGHWKKFSQTKNGAKVDARDKSGALSYGVANADKESFSTDFLTDRAIELMAESGNQPFLTIVSYPDPHGPNTVRAPYDRMYDHLRFLPPRTYGRDNVAVPKWLGNDKKHAVFRGTQMSQYFGMVKCIDDNLGRIFAALKESDKLDSTIIMMTSDHGDLCYEHDRLNKGNPYEGSARVPMLIRFPKRIPAGQTYTHPMGTVDVTPTLLGLAGIETDHEFEGRNLTGQFVGNGAGEGGQMTFLRNSGTNPQWVCAVDERYKLVLSVNDQPWLFDAEQDPDELLNFYRRPGSAVVTQRLAKALQQYGAERGDAHLQHPAIVASLEKCLSQ